MLQSAPVHRETELLLQKAPRHLWNGALALIGSNFIWAALILEIYFMDALFCLKTE